MHTITLPALDGCHQLGFLAAAGLTRLISSHTDTDAKLCFDEHTAAAKLTSHYPTSTASSPQRNTSRNPYQPTGYCPTPRPDYPATATNEGADPAWHTRIDYRTSLTNASAAERMWASTLFTDLATKDGQRVGRNLFTVTAGKANTRSILRNSTELIQDAPDYLHQALCGWRRVPGFTGEYLDHHAIVHAADHPDGKRNQLQHTSLDNSTRPKTPELI